MDSKVFIYNHCHNRIFWVFIFVLSLGLFWGGRGSSTVLIQSVFLPSLASGLEFLIYAENLAKMSIPAVFDSGCFGESFKYLKEKCN